MTMKYFDVTRAFPESKNNEEIYVTLRKGVIPLEVRLRVCSGTEVQVHARLLKGLYDLKQTSLIWFKTLDNFFSIIGLQKSRSKPKIYVLGGADNRTVKAILACVNDMILFSDDDGQIERFLKQHFPIKTLYDLDSFVRIKIERSSFESR